MGLSDPKPALHSAAGSSWSVPACRLHPLLIPLFGRRGNRARGDSHSWPPPLPGPQATFSCAAHLGSPSRNGAAASQRPTPTWQGPSQSLQNQSHQQPNSPPHLFHTSPDLIRFSSFLPVLGQSLLKTVENSFAPAVRKRLSPVRKIIKPSSHIRGNESPFLIGFAGRLFSSVLGKEVQTKSEQLPSGSCPRPRPSPPSRDPVFS